MRRVLTCKRQTLVSASRTLYTSVTECAFQTASLMRTAFYARRKSVHAMQLGLRTGSQAVRLRSKRPRTRCPEVCTCAVFVCSCRACYQPCPRLRRARFWRCPVSQGSRMVSSRGCTPVLAVRIRSLLALQTTNSSCIRCRSDALARVERGASALFASSSDDSRASKRTGRRPISCVCA